MAVVIARNVTHSAKPKVRKLAILTVGRSTRAGILIVVSLVLGCKPSTTNTDFVVPAADGRAAIDLGKLGLNEVCQYELLVKNQSQNDVSIKKILSSCGCVKILDHPATLLAGDVVSFSFSVDSSSVAGKRNAAILIETIPPSLLKIPVTFSVSRVLYAIPAGLAVNQSRTERDQQRSIIVKTESQAPVQISKISMDNPQIVLDHPKLPFTITQTSEFGLRISPPTTMPEGALRCAGNALIYINFLSDPTLSVPVAFTFPSSYGDIYPNHIMLGRVEHGQTHTRLVKLGKALLKAKPIQIQANTLQIVSFEESLDISNTAYKIVIAIPESVADGVVSDEIRLEMDNGSVHKVLLTAIVAG